MKFETCRKALRQALVVGGLCAGAMSAAQAAVVTYGFDTLTSLDSVTNQFAGLSFANATVLTAGDSLNEFQFPPASGANVLVDDGGPMEILFSSPVFSVGAAFTYATSLSFSIYDSGNALLGTVVSLGASNTVGSGTGFAANELLSFSSIGGSISRVVISGDVLGGSFVMDDLRVDFGTANPVPEPVTLALVAGLLGIGVLPGGWMRRVRRH